MLVVVLFALGTRFLGLESTPYQLLRNSVVSFSLIVLTAWIYNDGKLSPRSLNVLSLSILGLAALYLYWTVATTIASSITNLHEWDFLDFYISSSLAARGLDFYEPANFSLVPIPLEPSPEFVEEVMQVGSKYPPPSLLFFLPFGFLPYRSALGLWYAVNVFFFLGSVVTLSLLLSKDKPFLLRLLVVSSLFAMFSGVRVTFFFAQPNFIAIFFLACFMLYRNKPYAGIFLGISILFRPFLGLILVERILRRSYRQVAFCISFILLLSLLSFLYFGKDTFLHYFVDGPIGKIPIWMFSETGNVSLTAYLLRAGLIEAVWPPPYFHPSFLLMTVGITAVTLFFVARATFDSFFRFAACIVCGLIVYPETGAQYGVFLIFCIMPIVFAIGRRDIGAGVTLLAALVFALQNFGHSVYSPQGSSNVFLLSMCLLLGCLIWILWKHRCFPDSHSDAISAREPQSAP